VNIGAETPRAAPAVFDYTPAQISELKERMPTKVAGPRALGGTAKRFVALTWMLAYLDFKLKFFGSILGYVWQLVKPLMLFSVLYIVFTQVFRFGSVPYYGVVLLSGIVLYSFFSESTLGAVTSVLGAEGLIRKISFPIMAIPLASVTSIGLTLFLNYGVVIGFALANGITPTWRWIEIIPLLLLLYVVAASVAVTLSAYYVRFRDVNPIWEVIAQVLFYATPVIYPITFISDHHPELAKVVMCNPVATIIEQMRYVLIGGTTPSAVDVLGSWRLLAVPLGIVVLLFYVGYRSMTKMAPRVAEEL
jgi:ABC-2 type transport system permease protein